MGFPQYSRLPLELRLLVVEELIKLPDELSRPVRLAPLAGVHSEWAYVIERVLFRKIKFSNAEAEEFGRFCTKRQNLLDKVTLDLTLCYMDGHDDLDENQEDIMVNFSELFDVMKDWSCAGREHRLITLCISLSVRREPETNGGIVQSLDCDITDLTDLPAVPVIGKLFTKEPRYNAFYIHHSTVAALQKRLPNLDGASIALPSGIPLQDTISDARNKVITTHRTAPSLRMLRLIQNPLPTPDWPDPDFEIRDRNDEITIARSLTPKVSRWSQTLVSLKIDCIIDIPEFLLAASNAMWPNLETMDVVAILDKDEGEETLGSGGLDLEREYRVAGELLQGLTAALPGMRSLTKFDVRFRDPTNGRWACCLCMDLAAKINTKRLVWQPTPSTMESCDTRRERHRAVVPCGSSQMTEGGGTLVTRDVVLPGQLVTAFQDTVWECRRQEVAVCCCRDDEVRPGKKVYPVLPCTRWNKETGCWDFAFLNDLDVLIWQMGNFFEEMEGLD